MSLSGGFKTTLSRGFGKIKGLKFGRGHTSSLSSTPETSATTTSPSMDFSEDGLDDSDDEDCYDQVCVYVCTCIVEPLYNSHRKFGLYKRDGLNSEVLWEWILVHGSAVGTKVSGHYRQDGYPSGMASREGLTVYSCALSYVRTYQHSTYDVCACACITMYGI